MDPTEVLANLKDIHLPVIPDAWPPAFGWWLVLALGILILALAFIHIKRFMKKHKRQKQLLQHLHKIDADYSLQENHLFLSSISILLRRIAVMNYPRDTVADLAGKDWLNFLDQSGETNKFSKGPGEILADGPYTHHVKFDRKPLLNIVQQWIKKNVHV